MERTDVGVVVKHDDLPKADYGLDQAAALLHYYTSYFGFRYPLPKLDLIAAPGDISLGSMENWGSIFYSQDHLLFDPNTSTEADRQLVFLVVSHEMAHQWFGDLGSPWRGGTICGSMRASQHGCRRTRLMRCIRSGGPA